MNNEIMMIGGGVAALIVGVMGQGSPRAVLTNTQQSIAMNTVAVEIEQEAIAASNEVALSRYRSGACIRSTVAILEGMSVPPEYAGRLICDSFGTTAQIDKQGRLTLFAKTGDTAAITQGIQ